MNTETCDTIGHMAVAGIGLWVSMANSSVISLFHTETFIHMRDIDIAANVNRVLTARDGGKRCVQVMMMMMLMMLMMMMTVMCSGDRALRSQGTALGGNKRGHRAHHPAAQVRDYQFCTPLLYCTVLHCTERMTHVHVLQAGGRAHCFRQG